MIRPHTVRMLIGAALAIAPYREQVPDLIVIAGHVGRDHLKGPGGELAAWWPTDQARALAWARSALDYLPERQVPTGAAAVSALGGEVVEAVMRSSTLLVLLAQTGDEGARRLVEEIEEIAELSAGLELDDIVELLK